MNPPTSSKKNTKAFLFDADMMPEEQVDLGKLRDVDVVGDFYASPFDKENEIRVEDTLLSKKEQKRVRYVSVNNQLGILKDEDLSLVRQYQVRNEPLSVEELLTLRKNKLEQEYQEVTKSNNLMGINTKQMMSESERRHHEHNTVIVPLLGAKRKRSKEEEEEDDEPTLEHLTCLSIPQRETLLSMEMFQTCEELYFSQPFDRKSVKALEKLLGAYQLDIVQLVLHPQENALVAVVGVDVHQVYFMALRFSVKGATFPPFLEVNVPISYPTLFKMDSEDKQKTVDTFVNDVPLFFQTRFYFHCPCENI
jgi:hypothetical protein